MVMMMIGEFLLMNDVNKQLNSSLTVPADYV